MDTIIFAAEQKMDTEITTGSSEQTIQLGKRLGSQLMGGEVIALYGSLGAGKTHFVKGIVAGVGAEDSTRVNSPTFVIVNEYYGPLNVFHVDAYRLKSAEELTMVGFDEMCSSHSVLVIEWADKVQSILDPFDTVRIKLSFAGTSSRRIEFMNLPDYAVI